MTEPSREQLLAELEIEQELTRRAEFDALGRLAPNPKQWDFINVESHETLFAGLNQAGKSTALCMKASYHLTGLYPEGYTGPRFDGPIQAAIGGETAQSTRDLLCDRLLGGLQDRGSGYIPEECFNPEKDIVRLSGGVVNQIDYFQVRHHDESGRFDGYSKCMVFSYSTGWQRLQGYTLNWIGIDEEPPFAVYDEFSARLNATKGRMDISMTPLQGETELYLLFEQDTSGIRNLINYDIDDATHMGEDHRRDLIEKYRNHPLAEARLHGRPVRGAGLIYTLPDELLVVDDFMIPPSWPQIFGLDFPHGVGFFALAKLAYDKDNDVVYMVGEFKDQGKESTSYAYRAMGMGADSIPCAWPHDAGRGFIDGGTIKQKYHELGLNMLSTSSHLIGPDGKRTFAIMTVIEEVIDRMQMGSFKVFRSCQDFLREKRTYRHDSGKVKARQDDHLIDAMHKGMMMLREARPPGENRNVLPVRLPEPDFFGM
tara:strand:- start:5228 stop:6679 length:1452 start_codon:yes stop_codon:yes gene_type:complete